MYTVPTPFSVRDVGTDREAFREPLPELRLFIQLPCKSENEDTKLTTWEGWRLATDSQKAEETPETRCHIQLIMN